MTTPHPPLNKPWTTHEIMRTSLSYFIWEGAPWWTCGSLLLWLLCSDWPYASKLILPSSVHAANGLRWQLLEDILISQFIATLILMLLRRLWPHQVIRRPWPFIKDCLICPLLGVATLVLVLYGWDIVLLGAASVHNREIGGAEQEPLPIFYDQKGSDNLR